MRRAKVVFPIKKAQVPKKEIRRMKTVRRGEIRGNRRSKIYHCPGQNAYDDMEDSKNLIIFESEEEAMDAGYRKAKR